MEGVNVKILLSNDDGYGAVGLNALIQILEDLGHELWVFAPKYNQSGVGMKFSLAKSLHVEELKKQHYSCDGSPVDCVQLASLGFVAPKIDAFLSGINAGANLGSDLWYSGTAAAAREAAKLGLPSLALSVVDAFSPKFDLARKFLSEHLEILVQHCPKNSFYNINFPSDKPELPSYGKVKWANSLGVRPYQNELIDLGGGNFSIQGRLLRACDLGIEHAADSDVGIVAAAATSISLHSCEHKIHSSNSIELSDYIQKNFSQ